MNIFSSLPAGDTPSWLDDPITLPDGRRADATAWTLKHYLRGPSALVLTATASGAQWLTALTAAASGNLQAGLYQWSAVLTGGIAGAERITVATGQLTITPDVTAQAAGFDPRSRAQIALDACEAAMATFNATGGKVKKYQIAGREMEFQSIAELLQLHSFWKAKVLAEQAANSIAQGLGNPRALFVRFVKPQ